MNHSKGQRERQPQFHNGNNTIDIRLNANDSENCQPQCCQIVDNITNWSPYALKTIGTDQCLVTYPFRPLLLPGTGSTALWKNRVIIWDRFGTVSRVPPIADNG